MKKKIILIVVAVLLVISLVVGISYAYWRLTYTQTGVNKLVSSCFSMELANEKNNITLDSAYPISDEKGKALTPYSFTITNTCDLFASYTINLEMLEGITLDSKYIKSMLNSEAITNLNDLETTDPSIEGATESRILFRGSLGSGDSTDYTLRIWMDSDTPATDDTMNKIFQGKITVTAEVSTYSPVENGFTNLADALLVNEYQTTSLNVAKDKILSKQTVDFSKTAPIINWQEVHNTNIVDCNMTKGDPSTIGSYGVNTASTKVTFGTGYLLDSSTGYYTLEEVKSYVPSELDFENGKVYYYCGSTFTATGNDTIASWNGSNCATMFAITGYKGETNSTIELSSGNKIPVKIHSFTAYKYGIAELESDTSDKGIYKAEDDYGETYYYRGNVKNNNVIFAGYKWKVIRINGDGSVRLLYDSKVSENTPNYIARVAFQNITTDPTYMGYMYSNTLGVSYKDTIKNDNDSVAKTTLDNWYKLNIYDKGYSSYVADSGFCNDRSIAIDSEGDGYTTSATTYYAPRYRMNEYLPTFKCPNINDDLFTLPNNEIGNKALTYPVGMITVDEISHAGFVKSSINTMNYTSVPYSYWSFSTYGFSVNLIAKNYYINGSNGTIGGNDVLSKSGIRPVINLKADTEISGGIGTNNDPFIIK